MTYDARDIRLTKKPLEFPAPHTPETLLCHIILANIELLCGRLESAGGYMENALRIAKQLAKLPPPSAPYTGKFACFTFVFDDIQQVLPLPIINNTLILPELGIHDLIHDRGAMLPGMVSIKNITISYLGIYLHTYEVIEALNNAATAPSNEKAIDILSALIRSSLISENKPADPIDMASDYFSLARNLLRKGNISLIPILLARADTILGAFAESANTLTDRQYKKLRELKSELKAITGAIN